MKQTIIILLGIIINTNLFAQTPPVLDGKILYHAYSGYENWDGELFILDLADNSVTNISSDWPVSHAINGMFSPDGTKIVFMADEDGWLQDWDIFLWTIGDDEPVNLTGPFSTDREEDPKFSPDGRTIVYKKNGDIMTMDLEGNILANITNTPDVEESMPYYTSDGSKILYAPGAGATSDIYSINTDGTNNQAVVAQVNYQEYYPITRDDESFFYTGWVSSSNKNDQVYLKYYAISSPVHLPFNTSNANYSDATPLGSEYAVISSTRSGGEGGYDLYIADINTGNIWSLNQYNNTINTSWEELGAHYLPESSLSDGESLYNNMDISLYPNPIVSSNELNIKLLDSKIESGTTIEFIDTHGKVIEVFEIENKETLTLKVDYPKGVYMVRIKSGNRYSVKKLIVL